MDLYAGCCRTCLSPIDDDQQSSKINKLFEWKFKAITSEILRSSPFLSNRVCHGCHTKFSSFYDFKQQVVNNNKLLNQILDEFEATNEIERLHEGPEEGLDHEGEIDAGAKVESGENYEEFKVFEVVDYEEDYEDIQQVIDQDFEASDEQIGIIERRKGKAKDIFEKNEVRPNSKSTKIDKTRQRRKDAWIARNPQKHKINKRRYNKTYREKLKLSSTEEEKKLRRVKNSESVRLYRERKRAELARRRQNILMKDVKQEICETPLIVKLERLDCNTCPICMKFFNNSRKVKLHVQRVHKQIKNHKCDVCDYQAYTKFDVLRHMKTNHLKNEEEPKDLRICPDCGKVLKGNNHLNFHIKTKHLKLTKFSCDLCDFKSYGKYEIRSHIEIHHLPLELRKGFPCDLCPSVLTTAMSLKTHKTHKHSGLKPHKCYCGKAYALRETLKSHIRNVHNGERKYKCPHCEKGFNSNPRLRDHINNIHGTKQEIPCEKCGKTFNSLRNIQTHMIYHQPPQLKCEDCGKFFYIKKNLREHQESVHLGITHVCGTCNRTFQSTSGLRRHAKSHVKS